MKPILIALTLVLIYSPLSAQRKKPARPQKSPSLGQPKKPATIEPSDAPIQLNQPLAERIVESPLPTTLDVMAGWLASTRSGWALVDNSSHNLINSKGAITGIETWLKSEPKADDGGGNLTRFRLTQKNQDLVKGVISELASTKGVAGFVPRPDIIVAFARHRDDGIVLMLKNIISPNKYNTIRLDSKQRAAKTISSAILSSLQHFRVLFSNKEINYYGMIVGYGSENFLNQGKYNSDLMAEAVGVIVSADQCKRFVNGEITDDELIDSTDVYVADRDMMSGFKKIKLRLD